MRMRMKGERANALGACGRSVGGARGTRGGFGDGAVGNHSGQAYGWPHRIDSWLRTGS